MSTRDEFPDIGDILARKARGRLERARLSFGEKLDILDRLKEQVAPIVEARRMRRRQQERASAGIDPPLPPERSAS